MKVGDLATVRKSYPWGALLQEGDTVEIVEDYRTYYHVKIRVDLMHELEKLFSGSAMLPDANWSVDAYDLEPI